MSFEVAGKSNKKQIVSKLVADILQEGFEIVDQDDQRPWGAFFVIDPSQTSAFADKFFSDLLDTIRSQTNQELPLTPKILLVGPNHKLSWQYHHRRGEIWHILTGPVAIMTSKTDKLPSARTVINADQNVTLQAGDRHRLIGLDNWSIIAEIWLHTNVQNPSNEEDIVRLADEYGRNTPGSK